jgi:transposase
MAAQKKYPDELRERAVKMLFEVREREGKGHGELARVARQLGVHPEALRSWAKQAEIDGGVRPGTTTMISSGSRNWSGKTGSCAGRMRS